MCIQLKFPSSNLETSRFLFVCRSSFALEKKNHLDDVCTVVLFGVV